MIPQVRLDELCFVGDRLLTDVVFGNLHGMLTVHTQPLTLKGDNRPAAVFRFLERKVGWAPGGIIRANVCRQFISRPPFLPQQRSPPALAWGIGVWSSTTLEIAMIVPALV